METEAQGAVWLSLGYMRILRNLEISLESQSCSLTAELPSVAFWDKAMELCVFPNKKLARLHSTSPYPVCSTLPLEMLWQEFKAEIFRSNYHVLVPWGLQNKSKK